MAQSRSLVRPAGDPLIGTSPTEQRLIQAALYARAAAGAFGVRPGVLWGGAVSGTAGWSYDVAPAALVMSRGDLEGAYPAAITGVQNVPTDPGPGSGSRIDIVYVLQPDLDLGDTGNEPVLDVAIGAASGSPSAPALPPGALELGRATISSLMTDTLDATVASTAPITALHGGTYEVPSVAALDRIVAPLTGDTARIGGDIYRYSGSAWIAPDTGWLTGDITWAPGWDSYASSGSNQFAYRRKGGLIKCRGLVVRTGGDTGTISQSNIEVFTFPEGFRPAVGQYQSIKTNASWEAGVQTAGTAHTHPIALHGADGPTLRAEIGSDGLIRINKGGGIDIRTNDWLSPTDLIFWDD